MSEEALLIAVRDRIRTICGYSAAECDVQPDEYATFELGYSYVSVMPGELSAGGRHDSSGGVIDEMYSVDVLVIQRAAAVPSDRRNSLYLTNLSGIAERCRAIRSAVDFSYEVTTAADTLITESAEKFVTPLRWIYTGKMEPADMDIFKGAKYNVATHQSGGVKRLVHFGNCRRVTTR